MGAYEVALRQLIADNPSDPPCYGDLTEAPREEAERTTAQVARDRVLHSHRPDQREGSVGRRHDLPRRVAGWRDRRGRDAAARGADPSPLPPCGSHKRAS